MTYCVNCGTQIPDGQKFCANCGTPVAGVTAVPQSDFDTHQSEEALQKLAKLNAQAPRAPKSSGKKVLIAILIIFLFGSIAVVGGVVYVGYRVKQKASAALNDLEGKEDKNSSAGRGSSGESAGSHSGKNDGSSDGSKSDSDDPLSSVLSKLQGGGSTTPMGNMAKSIFEDLGAKNPGVPQDLIRNIPYAALTTPLPCPKGAEIDPAKLAGGRIQIKPGTVMTTSWSLPKADAESDHIIQSVSPASLGFELNGVAALGLDMSAKSHAVLDNTVCAKDLSEGEVFATGWMFKSMKEVIAPGLYPGMSRILLPGTKFRELKSSGSTELVFAFYDYMDALSEWELLAWKGTLTRVEQDDVQFPLIINDEKVDVPAIHLHGLMKVLESAGRFGPRDQPADAYILDDANTPVVLSWMFGKDLQQDDAFRVQYVRIRYPSDDKPTIEQQLAKNRKVITWGINFDFNSDIIRPVSEPVLKEIADAMALHSDWKLMINGHTDSIGGHKYNLDLSQRRSASVKADLVQRYHIDQNRLSTAGSGDSSPIDTNDTIEGRARNRRVELTLE